MPEMPKLTRRQQDILHMIQRAVREEGAAPTRVEIAMAFGFRSPNAAEAHLRALARKGVIDMLPGVSRGIRLKGPPALVAGQAPDAPGEASTVVLPLIGRVAAGSPILAQEQVEATFPVDARLFSARPDYLLRVRGWSMRDAGIWEGDLLAVRATPEARDGQTVVVRLGDEVTVKRLLRRGTHWLLRAANPDFPDRLVGPGESLEVEGVVVGLVRPGGWD